MRIFPRVVLGLDRFSGIWHSIPAKEGRVRTACGRSLKPAEVDEPEVVPADVRCRSLACQAALRSSSEQPKKPPRPRVGVDPEESKRRAERRAAQQAEESKRRAERRAAQQAELDAMTDEEFAAWVASRGGSADAAMRFQQTARRYRKQVPLRAKDHPPAEAPVIHGTPGLARALPGTQKRRLRLDEIGAWDDEDFDDDEEHA